jgi:acetyl-CoA carboxylase biotin carboxyl carrier protein
LVSIAHMSTQVVAHITGTVWEIRVAVGDAVQEGQTLIVLESMKMEMPIESPEAGKVSSISVSQGQAVEEGEVLLVLD